MKRFIILYFAALAFLFLFFYADTSVISERVNFWQKSLTLYFLDLLLKPGQVVGSDILISPGYKLIITQACNGMIPILFYGASVIAYPASLSHRIIWGILGYLVISAANILRLVFVTYMVERGRENFELAHDLAGNALLMTVGLGLFVAFIRTGRKEKRSCVRKTIESRNGDSVRGTCP